MLYLIHEQQKKKVIAGYYAQVWKYAVFVCVFVCVCIAMLAIPTIVVLQTEVSVKNSQSASLSRDIEKAESKDFEIEVTHIQNKISVLKEIPITDVRATYIELERIIEEVSGVRIISLSVDGSSKSITLVAEVQDKEVAKRLVDILQKTQYTGAVLPYSVLSQKSSFVFTQNLSYE